VLGRGGRNVQALRPTLTCLDPGKIEQLLPQASVSMTAADMQKLQLELDAVPADEVFLQQGSPHEALIIEDAIELSILTVAGFRNGRVFLGWPRLPTAQVVRSAPFSQ